MEYIGSSSVREVNRKSVISAAFVSESISNVNSACCVNRCIIHLDNINLRTTERCDFLPGEAEVSRDFVKQHIGVNRENTCIKTDWPTTLGLRISHRRCRGRVIGASLKSCLLPKYNCRSFQRSASPGVGYNANNV